MGRFVRDPDMRQSAKGDAICNFTLAVDRDFKDANGERQADFIDFVAFRRTAEFIGKYFTKGRMAVVAGHLQIDSYTDKDGIKRRAAKVVTEEIRFADSRRDDAARGPVSDATAAPSVSAGSSYGASLADYDDSALPY
jgi:single-strand DNA-binding protein